MKVFLILIAVLFASVGIWGAWSFYEAKTACSTASSKGSAIEVTIGSIQSVVTAQGTLEPKDYVDVGAQVSGEVIKLHVEIGDTYAQTRLARLTAAVNLYRALGGGWRS